MEVASADEQRMWQIRGSGATLTTTKAYPEKGFEERRIEYTQLSRRTSVATDRLKQLQGERRTIELVVLDMVDKAVAKLKRLGKDVSEFEQCQQFSNESLLRLWNLLTTAKKEQQNSDSGGVHKLTEDDYSQLRRANETVAEVRKQVDQARQLNQKLKSMSERRQRPKSIVDGTQSKAPSDGGGSSTKMSVVMTIEHEFQQPEIDDVEVRPPTVDVKGLLEDTEKEMTQAEQQIDMLLALARELQLFPTMQQLERDMDLVVDNMKGIREHVTQTPVATTPGSSSTIVEVNDTTTKPDTASTTTTASKLPKPSKAAIKKDGSEAKTITTQPDPEKTKERPSKTARQSRVRTSKAKDVKQRSKSVSKSAVKPPNAEDKKGGEPSSKAKTASQSRAKPTAKDAKSLSKSAIKKSGKPATAEPKKGGKSSSTKTARTKRRATVKPSKSMGSVSKSNQGKAKATPHHKPPTTATAKHKSGQKKNLPQKKNN